MGDFDLFTHIVVIHLAPGLLNFLDAVGGVLGIGFLESLRCTEGWIVGEKGEEDTSEKVKLGERD